MLRADGGEGASLVGAGKSRARYAQRDGRLLEERLPVIVRLTWTKRAGNTYRVSFGCRNADAIAMNTLRRLCGTMPPTHVSHPPTSFMSMWFSRTSDLRISAAKSPFRHRLHILEHVWVRPHEHACWHSLGRTTGSCVQIMHADMRANMYGPMRSLPFMCSCCTETGHICSFFEGEDPRPRTRTLPLPVVLGVKGLPVSLRRRRVLCTLPILQPCALRHALHY